MKLKEISKDFETSTEKPLIGIKIFKRPKKPLILGFTLSGMLYEFLDGQIDWKFSLDTSIIDLYAEYLHSQGQQFNNIVAVIMILEN